MEPPCGITYVGCVKGIQIIKRQRKQVNQGVETEI